ncbi:hypothetical protein ACSQ67_024865 [Phaseolus vulgaris]
MSSGGCDQPKPYLSSQNKGKRVMKHKRPRYVLKVNIPPPPNAPIAPDCKHTLSIKNRHFSHHIFPNPGCGINAFSIGYMTLNIIGTITIAKGYTIINTLTTTSAL